MVRKFASFLLLSLPLAGCRDSMIGAPRFTSPDIRIVQETLQLECAEPSPYDHGPLNCTFEGRYVLESQSPSPLRAQAVAYSRSAVVTGFDDAGQRVQLVPLNQADGVDDRVRAAAPPDAGLDDLMQRFMEAMEEDKLLEAEKKSGSQPKAPVVAPEARRPDLVRAIEELDLLPDSRQSLILRGQVVPYPPSQVALLAGMDALETRHPEWGDPPAPKPQKLVYLFPSYQDGPFQLRLRVPVGWSVQAHSFDPRTNKELEPLRFENSDTDVNVQVLDLQSPTSPAMSLKFQYKPAPVRHGGPMLAIGQTSDERNLARAGYEMGLSSAFVGSLSLDWDFRDQLVLAPVLEAATESWLIFPSVAAGAGLALQLEPELETGLRLQLEAVWPYLGLVATWDFYPGDSSVSGDQQFSLLGRFSF